LAGKPRNVDGKPKETRQECLTRPKEGQASVTKLSSHPRFLPCAAATKIILSECFLHLPWAL
jgi:hypothetical protein